MSTQAKQYNSLNQNGDPLLTDWAQVPEEAYLNNAKARHSEKISITASTPIASRQPVRNKCSNFSSLTAFSAPSQNMFLNRPSKNVASFEVNKNPYGSPEREGVNDAWEENSRLEAKYKSARDFMKKIPDEFNKIELEREFENFLRSKKIDAASKKKSLLSDSPSTEFEGFSMQNFFHADLHTPYQESKTFSSKNVGSDYFASNKDRGVPSVGKRSSPFYQYLSRASVYEYLEKKEGKMKSARSLFYNPKEQQSKESLSSPPKRIDAKGEAPPPASPLRRLEMSFVNRSMLNKQNFLSTESFKNLLQIEEKKLDEIIAAKIIEKRLKNVCLNSSSPLSQESGVNRTEAESEEGPYLKLRTTCAENEKKSQREKSKKRKSLAIGQLINKQKKKKLLSKTPNVESKKEKGLAREMAKEEGAASDLDVKNLLSRIALLEKKCWEYEEAMMQNQFAVKNLEEACCKLRDEKERLNREKDFALKCYSRLEMDYKKLDCAKEVKPKAPNDLIFLSKEAIREQSSKQKAEILGKDMKIEEKGERIRELEGQICRLSQEIKDKDNQAKQYLCLDQRLKELDDFQNKLIEENTRLKSEICGFEKKFAENIELVKKCNDMGLKLDSIEDLIRTLEKVFTKMVQGEEPSIEMLLGYHKGRRLKLFENDKLNEKKNLNLKESFMEKTDRIDQILKKLQSLVSEGMDIYTSKCGESCNIT